MTAISPTARHVSVFCLDAVLVSGFRITPVLPINEEDGRGSGGRRSHLHDGRT